jgi:hypothetical protein
MQERSVTIQSRINPALYQDLVKLCKVLNTTQAEFLRHGLKLAMDAEPEFYKIMMKRTETRGRKKKESA